MNAEQMFKELGMRKSIKDDKLSYEDYHQTDMCIIFELDIKKYTAFDLMVWGEPYASKISMGLHKAITKQLEELGWL